MAEIKGRNLALRPNYTGLQRMLEIREISKTLAQLERELTNTRRADIPGTLMAMATRFREAANHCEALAKEEQAVRDGSQ